MSLASNDTAPDQFGSNNNCFPAVYFLDSDLFRRSLGQLPSGAFTLSAELQSFLGSKSSLRDHAVSFFGSIHPWLPFIPKKGFYERMLSPLTPTRADHFPLLVAIKLVTTSPRTADPRSTIYKQLKLALTEIEMMGQLTLKILQALILVALYELGHAIYPSAYLTIGQCARYGIAMGLNRKIEVVMHRPWNLMDSEEERRTWWAIVILDRFIHLGCPERVPVTEEPKGDSILPMDDYKWEVDEVSTSIHTLSSPPSLEMGRFGLTVQAGILLGRVLRNLRDTSFPTYEPSLSHTLQDDEAKVLEKAISALTNISSIEAQMRGINICTLTKICYSALLILNTRLTKIKRQPDSMLGEELAHMKERNLYFASHMLYGTLTDGTIICPCPKEEMSPFLFDAIYRSALVFMQEYVSTGDRGLIIKVNTFKSRFEQLSERWKAAGVYLHLLEANDTTGVLWE